MKKKEKRQMKKEENRQDKQDELNIQQNELNIQQGELNIQQNELNIQQDELNIHHKKGFMNQLPALIFAIMLVLVYLVMGGVVIDFLSKSVQDIFGANYSNTTTATLIDTSEDTFRQVGNLVSLPITLALIGIAIGAILLLGRGGRA